MNGARRIATAAQAAERRHARIVPPVNVFLLHQPQKFALAHHGVIEIQTRKLDLPWLVHGQRLQKPVVKRPVNLELQRAQRVRDALNGVLQAVRPVVHRIDAPRVAAAVVRRVLDAVHHRVTQIDVRRRHVDLRPQHLRAIGKLAGAHPPKEIEVLGHRAVPPGAFLAGLSQRAARLADLLRALLVHVGQALLDHHLSVFVHLREIIRRVADLAFPLVAQPAHVLLDGIDVFDIFLARVGVIHAQHALALVVTGNAEIDAQRLRMTYVQIAVRLRWKTRADVAKLVLAGTNVLVDDFPDKIGRGRQCRLGGLGVVTHRSLPRVRRSLVRACTSACGGASG